MRIAILLLLALIAVPTPSYASKNIWTQCGIGAMIFRETGWAAAISNIIWDLGTTASSSASSSEDQCAGKQASAAKFINVAYSNIEEEIVIGEGAHLDAMLDILGCDAAARPEIISGIRTDFSKTLSDPSYSARTHVQKSEAFYNDLMENVTVKYGKHCS